MFEAQSVFLKLMSGSWEMNKRRLSLSSLFYHISKGKKTNYYFYSHVRLIELTMLQSLVVSSGLARSRIIYIINVTMPDRKAAMIECEAAGIMTAGRNS